jgi:hypothetical protein
MAISEITLDGSQSRTLAGLADAMIPAHGELPSWSEADPSGKWLARAMAARPELIGHLVRVLDGAADTNRPAEAERLRGSDPEGFGALSTIVAGSYYMNPPSAIRTHLRGMRRPRGSGIRDHTPILRARCFGAQRAC